MNQMKVSYCLAAYNHAAYITKLVQSVLSQDYPNLELIIVDDGSTDGTTRILEDLSKTDSRIKLVNQSNSGIVAARNLAFKKSQGEYISFIDSDDLLPLDRTRHLLEALNKNPSAPFAWGDALIIDANDNKLELFSQLHPALPAPTAQNLFLNYCFIPAVSVMFRRSYFERVGPLWGNGASCDYLRWIELSLQSEPTKVNGHTLGFWRQHGNNLSQNILKRAIQYQELEQDLNKILEKYPDFSKSLSPDKITKRLANIQLKAGICFLVSQQFNQASLALQNTRDYKAKFLVFISNSSIRKIASNFFLYTLKRLGKI